MNQIKSDEIGSNLKRIAFRGIFGNIGKMIKDVTDLEIYRESLRLLPRLYDFLGKIPISEGYLGNQGKRAGTSIPANIAEGFAKRFFEKEFKRYLLIALASCDELVSHLRAISIILPELSIESNVLLSEYKILAKKTIKLIQSGNLPMGIQFNPNFLRFHLV